MRRWIVVTQLISSAVALLVAAGVVVALVQGLTSSQSRAPHRLFTPHVVVGGAVALLLGLLAGVLVATWLAGRLVRSVREVSHVVAHLGVSEIPVAPQRPGIAELDALVDVVDVKGQRLGDRITAERQLANDLSHQLRTPLTALSMRLEEIVATDDLAAAHVEAAVALEQVERLRAVLDAIKRMVRSGRASQHEVDVDAVLAQQVQEWQVSFLARRRVLRTEGERGLTAWVSTSVLAQVVATLLENALVHGDGTTTLRTRRAGTWVVVEVEDSGSGVPAHLAARIFDRDISGASRSGIGLALARSLTETEGGRLELLAAQPACFGVFLSNSAAARWAPGAGPEPGAGATEGGEPAVSEQQVREQG